MCGIAGYIDFKHKTEMPILRQMTDSMTHRGPDDAGYEQFENQNCTVGFGQRRLSIIDLSPLGHQPMFSEDGNFVIVLNGEIYNYREIRKELVEDGFRFNSQSDTEVVLNAFIKWGNEAVHRFIGMFAFVIYNKTNQTITAFRDRAGVKPLYYYWKDGLFLFASELKAFHKHPKFKKELNTDVLDIYMKHGYIPAPHTIFKNTYKLIQGHSLLLNLKSKDLKTQKYWDVFDYYNLPKLDISENEALEQLDKILSSAFNYRMVADVPVGMFLSGGYDSSLVSAILQKGRTEKIKTFTIGFYEKGYNEAEAAKKIAEYLGTDHTEYYCTTKEAQDIIPTLTEFYDEPIGDSSAIPTTLVSQLARQHVTVSLSADGGDEQFGGYNRYSSTIGALKKRNLIPDFLAHLSAKMLNVYSPKLFAYYPALARYWFLSQDLLNTKNNADAIPVTSCYFFHNEVPFLLNQPLAYPHTYFNEIGLLNANNDFANKIMATDYKTYMVDDILTKVDRATMSVSLEGREPLLDHRIIEFAAQLPSNFKINGNALKYLLKQLTHKYIPKELMERPKMGFGVPITKWLNNELKPLADYYLNERRLKEGGIFNPQNVIRLKNYCLKSEETDTRIWFLLFFEMWKEKWM